VGALGAAAMAAQPATERTSASRRAKRTIVLKCSGSAAQRASELWRHNSDGARTGQTESALRVAAVHHAAVGSLEGRTALITGAARGIGRATAVRLARDGAKIAINYKGNTEAAAEAKRLVEQTGSTASLIRGDVSVDADAERVVKAALAFGEGRLDILVNNAGITRDNLLIRMSAEEWDAVLDLNLRGAFLVTKAAMRPMMKQRGGRIVNVSSVAGVAGNAGQANYAAAKAGLIGFTKTVAREMASRNITCNAVAPGFVPTDLTNALLKQMEETILKQIPLGRFGTVDDVAGAIAFLASDEAAYITGQVIVVDGGMVT
jgi:3-oxoacyl-[acyl-carrier protein] reductase